jgi:hypothetical protein
VETKTAERRTWLDKKHKRTEKGHKKKKKCSKVSLDEAAASREMPLDEGASDQNTTNRASWTKEGCLNHIPPSICSLNY